MSLASLQNENSYWMGVAGIAFFGLGGIVFLFQPLIIARSEQQKLKLLCRITEDGFTFGRYQFPFGAMKGRYTLHFAEVDEIHLNTLPVTALVNGNELIFLIGLGKDSIREAAERNSIPITEPLDVWELIGEEFLDTEYDDEHKERTFLKLAQAGLPKEEVQGIRKRLRLRMLLWTYHSMEWIYCGQYDMLNVMGLLRARAYWWSMEIALRSNVKMKGHSTLRRDFL